MQTGVVVVMLCKLIEIFGVKITRMAFELCEEREPNETCGLVKMLKRLITLIQLLVASDPG